MFLNSIVKSLSPLFYFTLFLNLKKKLVNKVIFIFIKCFQNIII